MNITEHFSFEEIVCPCCERVKIIPAFYTHMDLLEDMRQRFELPIIITSGYRCPEHNAEIGGALNSWHQLFATDIRPEWGHGFEHKLRNMYRLALILNFGGIGYYTGWIHLDTRPETARWRK